MSVQRALRQFCAVALLLPSTVVAACHTEEPHSPSVGLTKPVHPPELPQPGRGAPRPEVRMTYTIWLGQVQDVCKGSAPFFEFDSARPEADDQPTMQTLASCMIDGALSGKSIRLIGHTDPRGTEAYNEKLGLERAAGVKRYLVTHKVEASRVEVESAGEDQASTAPASWPTDRRVEVRLAR